MTIYLTRSPAHIANDNLVEILLNTSPTLFAEQLKLLLYLQSYFTFSFLKNIKISHLEQAIMNIDILTASVYLSLSHYTYRLFLA